jgi:3-phenylpropionate/cinnamic acid dioxygenase small subunit
LKTYVILSGRMSGRLEARVQTLTTGKAWNESGSIPMSRIHNTAWNINIFTRQGREKITMFTTHWC